MLTNFVLLENNMGSPAPKKTKPRNGFPSDPEIPFCDIYPKDIKSLFRRDIFTLFIVALFTIA